ncbi:MAG: undecaprenyl/decaprenyl-phosphate alpha-N-acetylglucosaminyl 1-phosphate transferase [Erysipelotrichaceae bacterium]|nr:undecaprenyl/decaprenyl-phosphate alpha-N-acetylglucosaminyl 1-phosphate transferase [Erysipelotrichaceae bacterium]
MGTLYTALPYIAVSFLISFCLTPLVKKAGLSIDAYAVENERTVHHGKIVRIGGIAMYTAFIIAMAIFVHPDSTFNAIIIGSLIVFVGGLLDDMFELGAGIKLGFQLAAALYVIFFGQIQLLEMNLAFFTIDVSSINYLISIFWIVGVTNAINLIDGLDGLSSGISIIVLCVIGFIGYQMRRIDVAIVCLILSGAIGGVLSYNFHPASIFVGDCGAQFMGFMIACLSLLGFKSSTFVSLLFPLIILFIPLADTCLAIIRRKLSGHKISEADKSHLHHVLMFKIGLSHRNTVLLLYLVTLLFAGDAILMYFNHTYGTIMLAALCIIAWIFIELTGMIRKDFHPLIGLCRRITGHPKKSKDARFDANRLH